MNWVKKHLNWTLFIGVLVIETPLGLLLYSDLEEMALSTVIGTVVAVLVSEFTLEIWYLYQKKRSYAYLLLNFLKPFYIPIGFIILLGLANKRTNPLPEPTNSTSSLH